MIQSFKCKDTYWLFVRRRSRLWNEILSTTLRELDRFQAATQLSDLSVPPGKRLEVLKGARKGQHSIKINERWRICFLWMQDGAHEVEICDHH